MLVSEVILKKTNIEYKIDELKKYLEWLAKQALETKEVKYNTALKELFSLLDKLRSYNALLRRHNEDTMVYIGETEVSMSGALSILDNTEQKIEVLTNVINNGDYHLDIFKIMEERDALIDEQILLLKVIRLSDWSLEV